MATWQQLRENVSRAWDTLVDGWFQLFERAIPLPVAVDSERSKASYKHGVLRIE